jgi:hypothetical protein
MLKVLFTVFPSPSSTLIYQGESVSVILTQRGRRATKEPIALTPDELREQEKLADEILAEIIAEEKK